MADDIVTRLRHPELPCKCVDVVRLECQVCNARLDAADEIGWLRAALAYACEVLSTYYDETTHPEEMMHRFLEEARHGR